MNIRDEIINASQDLVNWLNGNGLTNRSRRSRVPSSKIEALENALEAELSEQKAEKITDRRQAKICLQKHISLNIDNLDVSVKELYDKIIDAMIDFAQKPEINLRDELMKFYKWDGDFIIPHTGGEVTAEEIVDEYLKQIKR
jgi:hypothetical protein